MKQDTDYNNTKQTPVDVDRLAQLARLSVPPTQRETLERELEDLLAFLSQLEQVDTDMPKADPPAAVYNIFREDMVTPSLLREELLEGASGAMGEFFHVPGGTGQGEGEKS